MKTLNLILFLVFLTLVGGCDFRNSAAANNQHSAISQPTVNVNVLPKPTVDNSSDTEKPSETNNSSSNPLTQITDDEITSTPEKTVQAFYKALKERNRKLALKYAKPEVVRQLLKDKESRLDWRFIDCSEPKIKEYGDITCIYFFEGGGIGIFLRKDSNERYQIVSTYYMTAD